jgi:transposase
MSNDSAERRVMGTPSKHFPEEHIADGRPGRKPVPTRRVLEAVLWILNTGAQWHMLPQSYPNYKTVYRRFSDVVQQWVLRRMLTGVANELRDRAGRSIQIGSSHRSSLAPAPQHTSDIQHPNPSFDNLTLWIPLWCPAGAGGNLPLIGDDLAP